jgi:hypothetical protein
VTRLTTIAALALIPLACIDTGPRPDWQIYAEIVERRPAQVSDLVRCQALQEQTLAGDCAFSVVMVLAKQEGTSIQSRCAEVPEGVWREECFFVGAERARSGGDLPLAVQLCEKSGQFASDCAFHLWQRAMRTLAKRIMLETLAEQQPRMRSLHARWSELVGHFSEFDSIYWRKLFRAIWDGVYLVNPEICDQLDPDMQGHCLFGARIHLDHAIRASLREPEWSEQFCAGSAPRVSALMALPGGFPELDRFPDHPAHQATVDGFYRGVCAGESMPAHPDPPRRKLTERERAPPATQERTEAPTQAR